MTDADSGQRSGDKSGTAGSRRHGFGPRWNYDSEEAGLTEAAGRGRGTSSGSMEDYGKRRDSHRFGDERLTSHRQGSGTSRRRSRGHGDGSGRRPSQRRKVPDLPDSVTPSDLERGALRQLRPLGRLNADKVARHLVMVQQLLDEDPQAAYRHARYAADSAGRIAVVRETAAVAAYVSGHYAEALRDIRTARRLSGYDLHRAIEADCERALGHYDKALKAAQEADPRQLDDIERAELAMVVSGIRHEMGQTELGLVVIEDAIRSAPRSPDILRRLHSVRADRLEELGRRAEAEAVRQRVAAYDLSHLEELVEVFDIEDDYDQEEASSGAVPASQDRACQDGSAVDISVDSSEGQGKTFEQQVEEEAAELLLGSGQQDDGGPDDGAQEKSGYHDGTTRDEGAAAHE